MSKFNQLLSQISTDSLTDILNQADDCSQEEKQQLCLAYIKEMGTNVSALTEVPEEFRDHSICLEAVKLNGDALQYVPKELRQFEICIAAIQKSKWALKHVPQPTQTTGAPWKEYERICLHAIEHYGHKFEMLRQIPENLRSYEMCRKHIDLFSWSTIKHFPKPSENTVMTIEQYKKLCLESIKNIKKTKYILQFNVDDRAVALEYIEILSTLSEEMSARGIPLDKEMCVAAIEQNWKELKWVPKELLDYDLLVAGIKQNGCALQYIYTDDPNKAAPSAHQKFRSIADLKDESRRLSEEQLVSLCIKAVKHEALALEYVPEELMEKVIEGVTLQRILADDYAAWKFIPGSLQLQYADQKNQFLSQIHYAVITDDKVFIRDAEIKDTYKVYASKRKHNKGIVHVSRSSVDELLQDLKKYGKPLHLVLLDHATAFKESMACMSVNDILNCLKNYNVEKLILLGCNTVQSSPLTEEQAMIQKIQGQSLVHPKSAFVSVSEMPDQNDYADILKKSNADTVYFLIKTKDNTFLFYQIQKDLNDAKKIIASTPTQLTTKQLQALQKLFNKKSEKPFTYKKNPIYIRGGGGAESKFISKDEMEELDDIFQKTANDILYPHDSNVTINADDVAEYNKITPSFLKKIVDAIKKDPDLQAQGPGLQAQDPDLQVQGSDVQVPFAIKGFTNFVSVDTYQCEMIVARGYVYNSPYTHSMFHKHPDKRIDRIDRGKLKKERKTDVAHWQANVSTPRVLANDKTHLKSITVKVNKGSKR